MKKKIAILLAVLMLVFSLTGLAKGRDSEKIQWLIDEGWVIGRGGNEGYAFEKTITRAELTKMLVLLEGHKNATYENWIFTDVGTDHWANSYISIAASEGYIKGYEDGSFRPDSDISYNEAMAIMSRMHPNWTSDMEKEAIWPDTYNEFAEKYGILDGIKISKEDYRKPAIRFDIFEMVYNLHFAEYQISIEDRWDYDLIGVENGHKEFFNGKTWVAYDHVNENVLDKDYNLSTYEGEKVFYDFFTKAWRNVKDGRISAYEDNSLYNFGMFYDHYNGLWRDSATYDRTKQIHDFSDEIEQKGSVRLVADLSEEGKEFSHWEYDKTQGLILSEDQASKAVLLLDYRDRPRNKVTFKAIYKDSLPIKINFEDKESGNQIYSRHYAIDAKAEDLPNPNLAGHRFDGWYTKDGKKVEGRLVNYKDQSLYAKWIPSYQVTVNENNGNLAYTISVDEGTRVVDMLKAPLREGYKFEGWRDESGNWLDYRTPHKGMTIHAVWTKISQADKTNLEKLVKEADYYKLSD